MPLGSVLYEPLVALSHVYFPTTAIVSLLYVMENGASAEIAAVGHEGIVGVSLFMGGESTPSRAVVQSAGKGLRLKAQIMKDEFNRAGPVLHLFLRYTQALITQMAQTAVCNRHHTLDQQLCRWLLLSLDRLQADEIVMTQELIANMLGVRREGVTDAALKLQRAGLIRYSRGHIVVLDRKALEKRSCECYSVIKKEYERLLPRVGATKQYTVRTRRFAIGQPFRTAELRIEQYSLDLSSGWRPYVGYTHRSPLGKELILSVKTFSKITPRVNQ
jgi:CRP-like cAMP-binding protein